MVAKNAIIATIAIAEKVTIAAIITVNKAAIITVIIIQQLLQNNDLFLIIFNYASHDITFARGARGSLV